MQVLFTCNSILGKSFALGKYAASLMQLSIVFLVSRLRYISEFLDLFWLFVICLVCYTFSD